MLEPGHYGVTGAATITNSDTVGVLEDNLSGPAYQGPAAAWTAYTYNSIQSTADEECSIDIKANANMEANTAPPSADISYIGLLSRMSATSGGTGYSANLNINPNASPGSQIVWEIRKCTSGGPSGGSPLASANDPTVTLSQMTGATPPTLRAKLYFSGTTIKLDRSINGGAYANMVTTVDATTTLAGFTGIANRGRLNYGTDSTALQQTNFLLGAPSGPSFTVSPSTSTNAQSVVYTLTGSGTSWLTGTTFGISGVTGASITSQSCNAGTQVGTVTVLFDNTHIGTLTFTDSVDAATATTGVTLAGPGIPASPSCTAANAQNVLNWSVPPSGGLTATYNVYRGLTPGGESGTPIMTGISTTTFTDTGLTNGTTYYYKIAAVNATGIGTQSSEVFGTPSLSGVGNLTAAEALAAIGVMAHGIQPPFLNSSRTGLSILTGDTLVIPLNSTNTILANNLVTGVDSNNIYLGLGATAPMRGYGASGIPVGSINTGGGGAGGLSGAQALVTLAVWCTTTTSIGNS